MRAHGVMGVRTLDRPITVSPAIIVVRPEHTVQYPNEWIQSIRHVRRGNGAGVGMVSKTGASVGRSNSATAGPGVAASGDGV